MSIGDVTMDTWVRIRKAQQALSTARLDPLKYNIFIAGNLNKALREEAKTSLKSEPPVVFQGKVMLGEYVLYVDRSLDDDQIRLRHEVTA